MSEEVPCPLDCEYVGAPSSVEGHISACQDEIHSGKVGREFRDELRGRPSIDESERADVDVKEMGHGVDDETAPGLPAPSFEQLLGGFVVVLVVYVAYRRWGRSGGSGDETAEQGSEGAEEAEEEIFG